MQYLEFSLISLSALFVIINPITATFLFLSVVPYETKERQRYLAWRALKLGASILIVFSIFGSLVFQFFGITLAAFKIAGGIILFGISMRMIAENKSISETYTLQEASTKVADSVAIMPLAIPFLSGPGSITTVMILTVDATTVWHHLILVASIIIVGLAGYFAMSNAKVIVNFMGVTGKEVLIRLTGLILAVLAIQFIINGIIEAIHTDFDWLFDIIEDTYNSDNDSE